LIIKIRKKVNIGYTNKLDLSQQHHSLDDGSFSWLESADILVSEAHELVIDYCVNCNSLINGISNAQKING